MQVAAPQLAPCAMAFFQGRLRTHGKENGLAVVCAAKVGEERLGAVVVRNPGESCIVGADGMVLAHRATTRGPGLVVAKLARETVVAAGRRFPFVEQICADLFTVLSN